MPALQGTVPFQATSVAFSPFHEDKVAVSSAQHFGIVGNGLQCVMTLQPRGLVQAAAFKTQDAVYDCCWSEAHEGHLLSACGDGSIKLWDLGLRHNPWRAFTEHSKEVHGLTWNLVARETFASASWDGTIKLWNPLVPASLVTWGEHEGQVYDAKFTPHSATGLASAGGDRTVRLWDTRSARSSAALVGHSHEVLSVDWSKYSPYTLASASADRSILLWDTRRPNAVIAALRGHRYAVRRVKFSPFSPHQLFSASYDLCVGVWDVTPGRGGALRPDMRQLHTEFVTGLDCSLFAEGLVASCGWDRSVQVWSAGVPGPPRR